MNDEQRKKEIAEMIISNGGYCSNKNYKTYCSVCPCCHNADTGCGCSEIKADRELRISKCKEYLKEVPETKITINIEAMQELLATIEDEIEVNSIVFEIPSKKWSCLDDLRKMIKTIKGRKI